MGTIHRGLPTVQHQHHTLRSRKSHVVTIAIVSQVSCARYSPPVLLKWAGPAFGSACNGPLASPYLASMRKPSQDSRLPPTSPVGYPVGLIAALSVVSGVFADVLHVGTLLVVLFSAFSATLDTWGHVVLCLRQSTLLGLLFLQSASFWTIRTEHKHTGDENRSEKYGLIGCQDKGKRYLRLCCRKPVPGNRLV